MKALFDKFWGFIVVLWGGQHGNASSVERPASLDDKTDTGETRKSPKEEVEETPRRQLENAPSAEAKETITVLDRRSLSKVMEDAPQYFAGLRGLRSVSDDHYALMSRIGAGLIPYDDRLRLRSCVAAGSKMPTFFSSIWFGKNWSAEDWKPAAPKVMAATGRKEDWVNIDLYTKIPRGPFVPWGDTYYEWVEFATNTAIGSKIANAAYIGLDSKTGKTMVLSQPRVSNQALPRGGSISHRSVGIPRWVTDGCRDTKPRDGGLSAMDVHEYVGSRFAISMSAWGALDQAWQVHISHGGMVFRLCVPQSSAKGFFKDREAEIEGKRRPIFHIVSGHERQLPSGNVINVREHFRGNRKFDWAGHSVLITVPGFHHRAVSDFDVDAFFEEDVPKGLPMLGMGAVAERLYRHIRNARPRFHSFARGY